MKVVLSALIGSTNLGDEAIASIVINRLEHTPGIDEVTVLSRDIAKTKQMSSGGTHVVPAKILSFVKAVRKSDALFIGGGGLIQDETSVLNMIYYYMQIWVAHTLLRKKVYFLFIGIGPVKTLLGKFLLRRMSGRVMKSLVRDHESRQLLEDNGFRPESIQVSYDIVFNFSDESAPAYNMNNYVLFCPRDWFFLYPLIPTKYSLKLAKRNAKSPLYTYRNQLLKLITHVLETTNFTILSVAFYYAQDKDLIDWIAANLPEKYKDRFVVAKETEPKEYLQMAKGADAVIGVRLHSLILAAVAKIPVLPVTYSSKTQSLVKYMYWDDYTTKLDAPDFDYSNTIKGLEAVLSKDKSMQSYTTQLEKIRDVNDKAFDEFMSYVTESSKD